jgi:hypothetical protein
MIKLAERFFTWAVKSAAVMLCEAVAKRDEAMGRDQSAGMITAPARARRRT